MILASAPTALPGEEWREIPGVDPGYSVSSLGRIGRGRGVLRGYPQTAGYLMVVVHIGDKARSRTIHKLVCLAFHGPANGLQVNHKNGVKTDNRAENLEWVTAKENHDHAVAMGLKNDIPRGRAWGLFT